MRRSCEVCLAVPSRRSSSTSPKATSRKLDVTHKTCAKRCNGSLSSRQLLRTSLLQKFPSRVALDCLILALRLKLKGRTIPKNLRTIPKIFRTILKNFKTMPSSKISNGFDNFQWAIWQFLFPASFGGWHPPRSCCGFGKEHEEAFEVGKARPSPNLYSNQ